MRPLLSISATNFRSLKSVEVELRDLSVLVGPNGAGKTNLLRVIQFLGDTSRFDLAPAIEHHGGFEGLMHRGVVAGKTPYARRIQISMKAVVTEHASLTAPDVYKLRFWQSEVLLSRRGSKPQPATLTRRSEEIQFKRTKGRGRRITVQGNAVAVTDLGKTAKAERKLTMSQESSALSTLRRLSPDDGAKQVKAIASLFETFRVFEVDVNAARRPSLDESATQLNSDASNLSAFIAHLSSDYPQTFKHVVEDLKRISPSISALHVERRLVGTESGTAVYFEEYGLPGKTYLADASFGTIRALALLAMLHDPHPPSLTCVEEIDHGLHPHALDVIVERMRSAAVRTQLLVATHSPALVNRLKSDEIIVCERDVEHGCSIIPAINSDDIADMVNESNLLPGELWFSGALGGGLNI